MITKKILVEWKTTVILLSAIAAIALFLRLYNLTSIPVFVDEAIYVRWAQVMKSESTLRFLPLSDGKQPLFMWAVIPFLKVFSNPLIAGRFVSVITGMGSLLGIFTLSYLLFDSKRLGLLASFVYAISPFTVFFDRMALVDSMLTMFGLWTLIFSLLTAKKMRLDTAMLAGFALGGALLTKSPALFFVLLLPAVGLFVEWGKTSAQRSLQSIKLFGLLIVTWVIGYGMFNILRLGPNFHLINSRNLDYVFPFGHIFENPFNPLIPHLGTVVSWIAALGPAILLAFIAVGFFVNLRKYYKQVLLLGAWGLGPIFVQAEFAKVFTARYILFTIPILYLVAASSVFGLSRILASRLKLSSRVIRYLGIAALSVFIVISVWENYLLFTNPEAANLPRSERSGYLEEWTAGTGIADVADYLIKTAQENPSDHIVVGTEGYFGTLPDGLQIYTEGVSNITVIGVGLNIDQIPDSLKESKQAGNRTFLVANSSRLKFKGEFEDFGLRVVKSYIKAERAENTHEITQHGPRDTFYFLEIIK